MMVGLNFTVDGDWAQQHKASNTETADNLEDISIAVQFCACAPERTS